LTKKQKAKQKAKEEKIRQSDMMKGEAAKEINQRFRNGTLWRDSKSKGK